MLALTDDVVVRPCGRFRLRYRVNPDTGCHEWAGALHEAGYGIVGTNRDGTFRAHRVAYEEAKGTIPDGAHLDHLCRNRACINPDHLEPVTNAENARRGDKARLDWTTVREIRCLYAAGGQTYRGLARRFGVSNCAISNIINNKRWKEVDRG